MTIRDGIEGAILMSVGAAALTRERAESALADLVRRGQVGKDEGQAALEDLLARAKTEGGDPLNLVDRLPSGVKDALRDVGVVTKSDLDGIQLKLAELDHRLRLLEGGGSPVSSEPDTGETTGDQ